MMKEKHPDQRQRAIDIFQAGLHAVDPIAAIKSYCQLSGGLLKIDGRNYDLDHFARILVIGAGKAGASMARAVEDILGDRITEGIITVKYGHLDELKRIKIKEAGHPVPDENGCLGARAIYQLASDADEKTLVICLISGGGSALLTMPVDGVSLADKQATTKVLLDCGANIHEINTIRKHLSVIKGGGLARAVYPAVLVTLILSDVVGDDLDSIASGPSVPDFKTFADCQDIFDKYGIERDIPAPVLQHIKRGLRGEVPETPKAGQDFFRQTQNVIIASNFNALLKSKEKADELGYHTLLLSSMIEGETREVACNHIAIAAEIKANGYPISRPACLLSGGETTVRIKGNGKGGRNQEFALAAAIRMAGMEDITAFSAGTDGSDGPTDAAGAIADSQTLAQAALQGLDPKQFLDNNDSYHFFDQVGGLYKTGPTNTNVMDIRIILVE